MMLTVGKPNIADLITSQGWGDSCSSIEIFMGLEEGSVIDLSNSKSFTLRSGLPQRCLHQMLLALEFLALQGIVHRDVKPDNILFSHSAEGPGHHFRLADFGVGKLVKDAYSCQGTHWYMAPEILVHRTGSDAGNRIKERQSPKVDIWSLFVAIAYARDVCGYRERDLDTNDQILTAVREARREHWMSKYSAMAIENPHERASAEKLLQDHFKAAYKPEINDVKMTEDDVEDNMDPQPAHVAQHKPLVLKQRQSPRNGGPFKVEKRRSPCYPRTRLADTL